MARPEPRLVTIIKRLAELEAKDELSPAEVHDLNEQRKALEEWPEVNGALAMAYLGVAAR